MLVKKWFDKKKALVVQKVCILFFDFRRACLSWLSKGTNKAVEAYSAFASAPPVEPRESPLAHELFAFDIDTVYVVGLATDYCVRSCALDAKKAGFDVAVIKEAIRAVGGDKATADVFAEWNNAGVRVVSMEDGEVQKHLA